MDSLLFLLSETEENLIMMGVWIAVFLIALAVEFATTELVSVWFCVGAAFALIFTFIPGMPFWVEILVFFLVSGIAMAIAVPLVKKMNRKKNLATNADSMVGKKAKLLEGIEEDKPGTLRAMGATWDAVSKDEKPIVKGTEVVIEGIEGNKLVVRPVENQ